MECKFCKNNFANKRNLNIHQQTAKYCLKIQGKEIDEKNYKFICKGCKKKFRLKQDHRRHENSCKSIFEKMKKEIRNLEKENFEFENKNIILKKEVEKLKKVIFKKDEMIKSLQRDMKEVAIKAVSRPTHNTSNKTIQINNYIKNMPNLEYKRIEDSVPLLTLDHHVKGAEGYAEYALEFPFKDRIVCVDVSRNKIKYKNEDGDVIEDVGFRKMMTKLCSALKDRTFKLCQDHYEKLVQEFSEEEVDNPNFDYMEAGRAIYKYANGRESDFCNKIIKLISRGSKTAKINDNSRLKLC